MRAGICKLCLLKKDLQESHLLPAAAFAQLRSKEPGNEDPIFVSTRAGKQPVMLQTSKQVDDYVLCWDCEQLLRNRGEDWILRKLAVGVASPLYYALGGLEPLHNEPNFKTYSVAGNPEFEVEKIAHFALGVFFKAGAHNWSVGRNKLKLQLGSYLEPLRRFVLGEATFPTNCVLMLCIHPPTNGPKRLVMPYEWDRNGCHTYAFILVGLEFVISLGRQIPLWHRNLCFVNSPGRKVVVANMTEKWMDDSAIKIVQSGQVKGKLAKKLYRYKPS